MKNLIFKLVVVSVFIASTLKAQKTDVKKQPEELGLVSWYRNYDAAVEQSQKLGKPIFILFQEVPGCATCRNYGNDVLSHPLIVDAIENEFIPLAIYNNVKGHDREVLNRFNEPTWNNPVVRITEPNGKDLIKRLNGNYTGYGLSNYMLLALSSGYYGQPEYLQIAAQELKSQYENNTEEVTYSMYCFWTGEAHLGQLDGIISTKPGFMNGKEVVRVNFDKSKLSEAELTFHAQKANCRLEEKVSKFRLDKDPQYYLKQTDFKYLALTPLQKTKINSALKNRQKTDVYLSPSQKKFLVSLESSSRKNLKVLYDKPFDMAWKEMKSLGLDL